MNFQARSLSVRVYVCLVGRCGSCRRKKCSPRFVLMSCECQFNVNSMSIQCQFNVNSMSIQCQFNANPNVKFSLSASQAISERPVLG
ncbi:hypothetical protein BO99DRAFT_45395 [Aspergillus violaceofuscus CBS 115571]|uniref:Uncharacterized protein n=1 Tax=Aspergillus violaceofuscus (strain CBS 115571) TaxID=1450538 RepID=A0A2V5I2C4_ASPV1|nr:hypothetical protein BO99DRAFT_45395 [Aspergillus violaceofuscus CBS 115571]